MYWYRVEGRQMELGSTWPRPRAPKLVQSFYYSIIQRVTTHLQVNFNLKLNNGFSQLPNAGQVSHARIHC